MDPHEFMNGARNLPIRKLKMLLVSSLLLVAATICGSAYAAVGTWGAAPETPNEDLSIIGAPFTSRSFNNETVRQIVRVSAGGLMVQLRLSNEFGSTPLLVGETRVAVAGLAGVLVPGTDRRVTFLGQTSVVIPAGKAALSDFVVLNVNDRSQLAVSMWFPQPTSNTVWHPFAQALSFTTLGNTTAAPATLGDLTLHRFVLSAVNVLPPKLNGAIVAFGDSLTDGNGSTYDLNKRFPDQLADKFAAANGGALNVAVVNSGIGGNRLLRDFLGQAGVNRFKRDALGVPDVKKVIVLEGINDIGFSYYFPAETVTAADLIASYRKLIAAAHAAGVKIYGGTLTPFADAFYFSPEREAIRQAVNQWIRTSGAFDAVIDFDAAVRDTANPQKLRLLFDSGDHLHLNDLGYGAMADAAYNVVK